MEFVRIHPDGDMAVWTKFIQMLSKRFLQGITEVIRIHPLRTTNSSRISAPVFMSIRPIGVQDM